jgi:hypothetical protein
VVILSGFGFRGSDFGFIGAAVAIAFSKEIM